VDPDPDVPDGQEAGPLWGRSTLSLLINGERIKPPSPAGSAPSPPAWNSLSTTCVRLPVSSSSGSTPSGPGDRKVRAFVRDFEELSPEDQQKVWDLLEAHRPVRDE
jgi:hypothetical protein